MINSIERNLKHKPQSVKSDNWRLPRKFHVENKIIKTTTGKFFVPLKMRLKVLTICHGLNHGINQTIKSKIIWPDLRSEIKCFVENCRICALVRLKYIQSSATPILTKAPMKVVACDSI